MGRQNGIIDAFVAEPPGRLVVEVTETALPEGGDIANAELQLRKLGARVAVDDFGTGYSSLAQLRTLPRDILKLDASFIRNIDDSSDDSFLRAVVDLARSLGVKGEGPETQASGPSG